MTTQARTEPGTGADAQLRPYGQYMLVRKLAEGGMAEIFLAKRLGADGFERNVVIKRMLPHLSALPDFVEMFRDEARLAAKLQHPNVVQIHELGEIEGCYYICMEYLPGEDFSTTVRTASYRGEYVPVPLVMRVLADAARGLHYAHDFTDESGKPLNIVHRDISPSNLYVTYEGQVKVLDFGIAKAESRLAQTRTGVVKGKYVYMAPEQARGGAVDRRADVFSLGVSLYEAVTHVRPFARDNDLAVLNALLDGDFQPPRALRPDLSPDLEAVILKAMAYEPAHRYATAGEFADALEALLARESDRPTGSSLAAYLRQSFGEERYTQKTRIPTLTKLSQSGIAIPVMNGAAASEGRTSVVPSPSGTGIPVYVEEPRGSRKGLVVGLVATFLLLAGGAFVAGRNVGTPPAPNPVATPAPPAPSTAPAPAPAVAPTAVAEAQQPPAQPSTQETPAAAVESAVTPPPEVPEVAAPVKTPVRTTKARVTLEAGDIQRVVSKGQSRISTCFEQYKRDLPADEGEVKVLLSIFSSGRTNAVTQGPLAKQPVGRCLEKQVERLRFPAHLDKEVTVVMPFAYRVTR
ncbi:protein kinase domain-containing protein [Archangium sp.]|uniref:protein kinase domain-containing protein n=1 Tax=Archangium sp. TaxID=1872627 RepID=UPI00286CB5E1|nr:protein kinase [Archangium sp.]